MMGARMIWMSKRRKKMDFQKGEALVSDFLEGGVLVFLKGIFVFADSEKVIDIEVLFFKLDLQFHFKGATSCKFPITF